MLDQTAITATSTMVAITPGHAMAPWSQLTPMVPAATTSAMTHNPPVGEWPMRRALSIEPFPRDPVTLPASLWGQYRHGAPQKRPQLNRSFTALLKIEPKL